MNLTLRITLKILAFIALVLSGIWAYFNFGYGSVIAVVVSLVALIGSFVTEPKNENKGETIQVRKPGSNLKNNDK